MEPFLGIRTPTLLSIFTIGALMKEPELTVEKLQTFLHLPNQYKAFPSQ